MIIWTCIYLILEAILFPPASSDKAHLNLVHANLDYSVIMQAGQEISMEKKEHKNKTKKSMEDLMLGL